MLRSREIGREAHEWPFGLLACLLLPTCGKAFVLGRFLNFALLPVGGTLVKVGHAHTRLRRLFAFVFGG